MAVIIYMIGFLLLGKATAWTVDIAPEITVHMNQVISVPISIHNISTDVQVWTFNIDQHIAKLSSKITKSNETAKGILNITGIFLGRTKLMFTVKEMMVSAERTINLVALLFRITNFFFF